MNSRLSNAILLLTLALNACSSSLLPQAHVEPMRFNVNIVSKAGIDGAYPDAGLVDVKGVLYGTTYGGGTHNLGTVFRITLTGDERVLHSFRGGSDGALPFAGLTELNGVLYGTTTAGGTHGRGSVFRITPSGEERVLYSFKGGTDGSQPWDALVAVSGTLYGTTADGGGRSTVCTPRSCGTVFSITTSGEERVLHRFSAGSDGAVPVASLILVNGILYGTTLQGGTVATECAYRNEPIGCGTAFSITTGGKERVIHRFGSDYDGLWSGLLYAKGLFYGTTSGGGAYRFGTGFAMTTSGSIRVLHNFGLAGVDGAQPLAGLISADGALYGTTSQTPLNGGFGCCGTVFRMTASGAETVLYAFRARPDGAVPYAGLIEVNGTFYGTTRGGGGLCSSAGGCGTVFKLTRNGSETVLHAFGGSSLVCDGWCSESVWRLDPKGQSGVPSARQFLQR